MLVECREEQGHEVCRRIYAHLADEHVEASIGLAPRVAKHDLGEAGTRADAEMYRVKRARKGRAEPPRDRA